MISLLRSDMNFIKNNHFVLVVHPQVFVKSCIKISSDNNEIGHMYAYLLEQITDVLIYIVHYKYCSKLSMNS